MLRAVSLLQCLLQISHPNFHVSMPFLLQISHPNFHLPMPFLLQCLLQISHPSFIFSMHLCMQQNIFSIGFPHFPWKPNHSCMSMEHTLSGLIWAEPKLKVIPWLWGGSGENLSTHKRIAVKTSKMGRSTVGAPIAPPHCEQDTAPSSSLPLSKVSRQLSKAEHHPPSSFPEGFTA